MDNQQSNEGSGGPSLPRLSRTTANSYIRGDGSGNSGSNNNINCGNTTNFNFNQGDMGSSPNYAQIMHCLYTSAYGSHRNRISDPVEGTCAWVTEHPKYKEWLGKETSGLLWLSADPGCGKSVIASFLVTHLKARSDAEICFFFFKDDSEEQRSAKFALCAILHQLFVQKKFLRVCAADAFEAKGSRFIEEVDTLWDILVKAVAEEECGDVICVLDALDECEQVTLAQLIRHMTRLPGSKISDTPLKFLVTSRPYHKIEKELSSRATTIRLKGEDEVNAITVDVSRVIDNGIKELELVWENPGGLGYLRNLLESKADRTFLWVSLVLEILKDSEDSSREEFTNIVSTSPGDLAKIYTNILDKSTDQNKARRILHIVVAAARPLTLVEMNAALRIRRDHRAVTDLGGLPPGFSKTLKNLCGLFVRIIDSKVYLVHQTAREFLIKGTSPGQGKWQYTLSSADSSFILADICVSYLSLQDFESNPSVIETAVQKHPFLDYAATHWGDHLRDSQDLCTELFQRTRLICKGGSNRFLTWLKMYWENSGQDRPFPNDFTQLMIAAWFGQRVVVERLFEEGGDINARSKGYGTALNVAALRRDEDIVRMLMERNVVAYVCGVEYNILNTKRV